MSDSFWYTLIHNPFLWVALLAALSASFAGGIVGSYVVSRRIVFITGSISHAILGGIGLFILLHYHTKMALFTPLIGALVAAIFFAFLIGWIHLRFHEREDSIIAAIWSIGMAFGVISISMVPGTNPELMNFLFGSLLWANISDLWMLIIFDLIIAIICLIFHKRFLAICFDETQSYLQNQKVVGLYFLLLLLVAITVVLMIQVVGAILIISLLCLPAAIANLLTKRLSKMIFTAIALSCLFSFLGIYLSYLINWPPGATIAFVITLFYFLSLPLKARSV